MKLRETTRPYRESAESQSLLDEALEKIMTYRNVTVCKQVHVNDVWQWLPACINPKNHQFKTITTFTEVYMAIAAKHAMKLLIVLIALCGVASSQTLTLTANNVC